MAFDFNTVLRAQRDVDDFQRILQDHRPAFDLVKQRAAHSVLESATSALAQHESAWKQVANGGTMNLYKQLATGGGITSLSSALQDITRSMAAYRAESIGRLAEQASGRLIDSHVRSVSDIAKDFALAQSRPLEAFTAGASIAKLAEQIKRDSWRPILMRDFDSANLIAKAGMASAMADLNTSIAKTMKIGTAAACTKLLDTQARQAHDAVRAMSSTAGAFSMLKQMAEIDKDFKLRSAWVAPVAPERHQPAHRYPATRPQAFTPLPTEAPPIIEGDVPAPNEASEDSPYQLIGKWQLLQPLQPVENALYGILHGPLVVKILATGVGQVVVAVIGGGAVYFLFYCC